MKQKLLGLMMLIGGISLQASGPGVPSPVRNSPQKELTREQVEQFNQGLIGVKEDRMEGAIVAARSLTRLLNAIQKELQRATVDLNAWQKLADDFIKRLPKALGAPTYLGKYDEPLLAKPSSLDKPDISLQEHLRLKIEWLEDMDIAPHEKLNVEKRDRLVKFYQDVQEELAKQSQKAAELQTALKRNDSLTEKVVGCGSDLTWNTLKFMVYARKTVAAVAFVATGVFAYWLWNRPAKRCEPGVVYCK